MGWPSCFLRRSFLGAACLSVACSDTEDPPRGQPLPVDLFNGATQTVRIEVDYMPGAEPYVQSSTGEDVWEFFGLNARRMFIESGVSVEFPLTLAQMEMLPASTGDQEYSIPEILDLAATYRDLENGEGTATFYFIWLDGVFFDQGQRQEQVLGLSIGDTGVLAMFKPVIAGEEIVPVVASFVEQTTLIHEFGHAVGLVDRGLPLTSEHEDPQHTAHCSNPDCVMYWATARLSDAISFAQRYQQTQDPVVFGPECLQDLDVASGL